jgi:protease IV
VIQTTIGGRRHPRHYSFILLGTGDDFYVDRAGALQMTKQDYSDSENPEGISAKSRTTNAVVDSLDAPTPTERLPHEIVLKYRGTKVLSWFALAGWMGFALLAVYVWWQQRQIADFVGTHDSISEQMVSGKAKSRDKIAVITVAGVIHDGHGYVRNQIEQAKKDKTVKAVVLRINSPGGTVSGSDYIYHHLQKLREERDIPIVVSMGGIAASGGYYIAMAVGDEPNSIYAEPTSTTGSIGVIIPHYNYSGLMSEFNVVDDSIQSHDRKTILSPSRPISEDHRILLQGYVDELFEGFKKKILAGRPAFRELNPGATEKIRIEHAATARDLATGEIFTANQALKYGLVDRLGFLEDAIERAGELAGVDAKTARVIRYNPPSPWIELPYLNVSPWPTWQGESLLDWSSPQAYYLSSVGTPALSTWRFPLSFPPIGSRSAQQPSKAEEP